STRAAAPKSRSDPESTVLFPLTVHGFPVQRSPGTVARASRDPRIARPRAMAVVSEYLEFTNLLRSLGWGDFKGRGETERAKEKERFRVGEVTGFWPEGQGGVSRDELPRTATTPVRDPTIRKSALLPSRQERSMATDDRDAARRRFHETMRRCDILAVESRRRPRRPHVRTEGSWCAAFFLLRDGGA